MTTTILALIALSGSLAPAATPEFAAQTDYGQALQQAAVQKKPMVVLIGKGDAFAKLMADKALSADAKKVIAEKYVCVSVNVETETGKALARQFEMNEGGLVISGTGGTHQALRQSGSVSAADLAKHAATYADAGTPKTTVTVGVPTFTPAYYPQYYFGGCSGGSCPNTVIPSGGYVYPSTPSYGSSCPNGRCPTPSTPFIR